MRVLRKLKKTKATRILGGALGLLLVLALLVPVPALAIPPSGHVFHGNVTSEGVPVLQGTPITASVPDGPDYTTQTIDAEGSYSLLVEANDPDTPEKDGASADDLIEFYIDVVKAELYDVAAGEWLDSYPFEIQGLTELNLETTRDLTPPTVVSIQPLDAAIDVAIDAVVSATFDEEIQAGDNFAGIAIIEATGVSASIDGATLTIDHDAFDSEVSYTVTIPAGAVNDLADNPLAEAKVWSFTTMTIDTTPPTVESTTPEPDASASIDVIVSATFDEAIDDETTLVFTLDSVAGSVAGTVSYVGATNTASFTPDANLDYEITYTASVEASDLAGNAMAEAHTWSFTTVVNNPPTASEPSPADQATNVLTSPQLSVLVSDLDEDLMAVTFYDASDDSVIGTVEEAASGIRPSVTWAGLDYVVQYSWYVKVSDAINPEVTSDTWSFTTRAEGPVSFPVNLPAGWNLLSTPIKLDADSDALEQILGESLANIEASWRWDAQSQQWAVPTGYELSPLEAVYLKVSSGASATAEFVPYQDYSELPSRELQPGLNLIGSAPALGEAGFPDMPLDQALISIAEAEGGLTGYTMVVSPAHNQPSWAYALGGEIEDLLAFNGYWVVMENADTLFGFSTTPTP